MKTETIKPVTKLKKIDDNTFQEITPAEGKSKPREWKRNFNRIKLSLSSAKVTNTFHVNSGAEHVELRKINEKKNLTDSSFAEVKADPKIQRGICWDVTDCEHGLCLYELKKEEGDFFVYRSDKQICKIRLSIFECDAVSLKGKFLNEIYHGNIWTNHREHFVLGCSIPSAHMDKLIQLVDANPYSPIEVQIDVLSFSYGKFDFLIIEGAPALISTINASYTPDPLHYLSELSSAVAKKFKENMWPILFLIFWITFVTVGLPHFKDLFK